VNDQGFPDILEQVGGADLALVWGCGKIQPNVFNHFKEGLINVHRGIVQRYRGLDSEYWAIYHHDFDNIGVTLHYVNEELDAGDIVAQDFVELSPDTRIHHLKYLTSVMATDLMLKVLDKVQGGNLKRTRQTSLGRYYSAMPTVLIQLCMKKFKRHIRSLKVGD
jgi:methionyl-tRNA formyltransferase